MTYARADQKVTVEFTVREFAMLLALLGAALDLPDKRAKTAIEKFLQELNRTNNDIDLYYSYVFTEEPQ